MRKLTALLACALVPFALAAPAQAGKGTHVQVTSWHLYTNDTELHKVKPGATFKACASNQVIDTYAKGSVKRAKKGAKFQEKWSLGDSPAPTVDAHWARDGNFTDYFRFQPEGSSGKLKLKLVQAGKTIGKSAVTIKTKQSC